MGIIIPSTEFKYFRDENLIVYRKIVKWPQKGLYMTLARGGELSIASPRRTVEFSHVSSDKWSDSKKFASNHNIIIEEKLGDEYISIVTYKPFQEISEKDMPVSFVLYFSEMKWREYQT